MAAEARTRIRGGSGLGDALYLRPIAEHLVGGGHAVTVCTNYPDVFIGAGCSVEPFRRERVDMVAHYVGGKENPATTIWEDLCAHARVSVPLRFAWSVQDTYLVGRMRMKAAGKPIVLLHGGRNPMARKDNFGIELLPREEAFEAVVRGLGTDCFTIRVGAGPELYPVRADIDLTNQTTVAQLLDLAWSCAGVVSMCGFPLPMAEAFDKPGLFLWAARGLASANPFIRTVTPSKMLTKPTSRFVVDNWPPGRIEEGAHAFRAVL